MNKLNIKDIPKSFPKESIWRGRKLSSSQSWVFGFPGIYFGQPRIWVLDIFDDGDAHCGSTASAINPDTLSQCTGKTDKNGDLIFFGDLTSDPKGNKILIKNVDGGAISAMISRIPIDSKAWKTMGDFGTLEIVGTIWDKI